MVDPSRADFEEKRWVGSGNRMACIPRAAGPLPLPPCYPALTLCILLVQVQKVFFFCMAYRYRLSSFDNFIPRDWMVLTALRAEHFLL